MLTILLAPKNGIPQNFADPAFYLIDSLDLDKLRKGDRELIDTSLFLYHKTNLDTVKLGLLEHIVDDCWDDNIWPSYNIFLINKIKKKLTIHLKEIEKNKIIYYLAGAISNRGFFFDQKGDMLSALDYYHESLRLYESINNKEGTSTAFNNLGVLYSIIGDTSRALEYHHKSLVSSKELLDYSGVAMSYNNIGNVYESSDLPFIALEYYESSLKIREKINDDRGKAIGLDNIGDIYFSQEVYSKAYNYYLKANKIWLELESMDGISSSQSNLANTLLKLGRLKEAKKHAIESMNVAEELGYPMGIENSARTLSSVYNEENNFEKALFYLNRYINMRDNTRNAKNAEIAYKKSMQYEYKKEILKDSLKYQKEREIQVVKLREKETQTYALYFGISLMLIVLLIAIRSYHRKKKDNILINEQKTEVESQKVEIEKQHISLAYTHNEISDSIRYAKQIQEAILPTKETLNAYLNKGFVLYLPKDVISGDFYWTVKIGDKVIFAAADCTGHGVPGAMVSVVCHNALNRAVREFNLLKPADILDKTREFVIEAFSTKDMEVKDGMDISICCWNKTTNELQWAGANNPLYIVRASNPDKLEIIAADRQPVGLFHMSEPFTNNDIQLYKNDIFYLFTDGFQDQFGGPMGKKYKTGLFRKFLLTLANKDIEEHGELLKKEFIRWKGNYSQIDDVCIIGVSV